MSRLFKTVDYEATLDTNVRLGDCLPADHLARFIVDIVAQLDLKPLYARYGSRGGAPYAPEILLGLLFYAYATGVFSSRKIERATQETAAFRYLAGNLSPDHDTLATFRKQFLPQLQDLFIQILLLAQQMGLLEMGNISLDGTKIHADASKSKAVSYKRLQEIQLLLAACRREPSEDISPTANSQLGSVGMASRAYSSPKALPVETLLTARQGFRLLARHAIVADCTPDTQDTTRPSLRPGRVRRTAGSPTLP